MNVRSPGLARGLVLFSVMVSLVSCVQSPPVFRLAAFALVVGILAFTVISCLAGCKFAPSRPGITILDVCAVSFFLVQLAELCRPPNTLWYAIDVAIPTSVYLLSRIVICSDRSVLHMMWMVAIVGSLFSLFNLGLFTVHYLEWRSLGLADLTGFREMLPMIGGPTKNDCVTLELSFLPAMLVTASRKPAGRLLQIVARLPLTVTAAAVVLGFSRGAYIGLLALLGTAAFLSLRYRLVPLRPVARTGCWIAGIVFVGLTIAGLLRPTLDTASVLRTASQRRSISGRMLVWKQSAMLIRDHLWTGVGGYNAPAARLAYPRPEVYRPIVAGSYNFLLQGIENDGVLGVVPFLVFVVGSVWFSLRASGRQAIPLARRRIAAVMGAGMVGLIIRDLSYTSLVLHSGTMVMMWLMSAWSVNSVTTKTGASDHEIVGSGGLIGVSAVVMLAACGLLYPAYSRWLAEGSFQQSLAKLQQRDFEDALAEVQAAEKEVPAQPLFPAIEGLVLERSVSPVVSVGRLHLPWGRLDVNVAQTLRSSAAAYERAIALSPNDAGFHHNLGYLYELLGDSRARVQLEDAVELYASQSVYLVSLGLYYERHKTPEAALPLYARAVAASPRLVDSPFFRDLCERCPRADMVVIEQALDLLRGKEDPVMTARIGRLHAFQRKRTEALREMESALKEMPNLPEAWLNLGDLYLGNGHPDRAVVLYRRALLLDPGNLAAHTRLADRLYDEGKEEAALASYGAALGDVLVSAHAKYCYHLYRLPTAGDDLVPAGLLRYCEPVISTDSCKRLRSLSDSFEVDMTALDEAGCTSGVRRNSN